MHAQVLATDLVEQVMPLLDAGARRFIDTYFQAGEWEIVIGLAAEVMFKLGMSLPAGVLQYEEEISHTVVDGIRAKIAAEALASD